MCQQLGRADDLDSSDLAQIEEILVPAHEVVCFRDDGVGDEIVILGIAANRRIWTQERCGRSREDLDCVDQLVDVVFIEPNGEMRTTCNSCPNLTFHRRWKQQDETVLVGCLEECRRCGCSPVCREQIADEDIGIEQSAWWHRLEAVALEGDLAALRETPQRLTRNLLGDLLGLIVGQF